jgi:Raf kinase inhibitor-like YbhB/YbcL family protein
MRAPAAIVLLLTLTLAPVAARSAEPAMQLTSPAFAAGAPIPARYSAYGENRSPPLRWTAVAGARAYALSLQDPDAPMARPFVHWLAWNIPADALGLPDGGAGGAVQGRNDTGHVGYFGPRPPSGTHHYHFKLFALDAPLTLAAGADLPALTAAMRGHVLASAELVATYTH